MIDFITGLILYLSAFIYFIFIKTDLTKIPDAMKEVLYYLAYFVILNAGLSRIEYSILSVNDSEIIDTILFVGLYLLNNLTAYRLRKLRNKRKALITENNRQ
jgi:hypothetical protein